ncbi:MAG TPA: hypothetical protein VM847_03600, partial [Tahibacter sp.]|nr:hypothetical protein [Tahibacter sp.]
MSKDSPPTAAARLWALLHTQVSSDRANAFARFLWQRFRDDRCPQSAGTKLSNTKLVRSACQRANTGNEDSTPRIAAVSGTSEIRVVNA